MHVVCDRRLCCRKGLSITYATSHESFAPKIAASLATFPALERLAKGKAFKLLPYAQLDGIRGTTVTLSHRFGGQKISAEADTLVFVSHNVCNREQIDELEGFPGRVIGVGDVRSPRYLQTAIREGHMAARFL